MASNCGRMAGTLGSLMSSFVGKTKAALNITWDVYSKPTPRNLKEIFGLIVLCLAISVSTGGLLYVWMNFTLHYDPLPSLITAVVSGSTLALVLFFLHPMRCAFTIILPSLGTKQGRKILISTALTILATKCIPNMVNNVSSVVVMMKCSTQVAVEGILSSTEEITTAVGEMKTFLEDIPDFTDRETIPRLQQGTNIDEMKQKLEKVSEELKADISTQQKALETTSSVVQKVIAVAFILLLLGSSVWYLIGYLTDLTHNNVYITHRLMELLKVHGVADIPLHYKKKLVKTTGWKMTRLELKRGLLALMTVVMYGLISAVIIGLDYFAFNVLQTVLEWAHDVPQIHCIIKADLKISLDGTIGKIADFLGSADLKTMHGNYPYDIPMLPPQCVKELSPPEQSVLVTVGALYFTAFFMTLMEVYARRMRRKICTSFYRKQEEERVQYLLTKVLKKREESVD